MVKARAGNQLQTVYDDSNVKRSCDYSILSPLVCFRLSERVRRRMKHEDENSVSETPEVSP